ncbi:U11/U12 small nuclear ribonucleoprotein 25 kDa protein-like [Maniola jurtina]|uniref:U11/U12 small nuclear ribonucleoprotein 25 kDa protein-like n=1 Tax=Maniola jurtina TaxID=191418 RepID=UPI001E688FE6|nr:U11/U12 small nuclear ribonucleoprotein 25 kDa protein-like [Maniola jurtina]XP_045763752.1 U11/U12 small nuclear ribonucleoprotein 25 kDa protein-like [Maniola jurtina]XP_045763760.1 U11/U12 small nuclear ribonucleoprotein 25 kDa protein-like [Maniola jurtina]XP_045763768.1 U11/U12 small nuclear ribonucleoprotein 25 kDa protein-like [Maniola jurtina]
MCICATEFLKYKMEQIHQQIAETAETLSHDDLLQITKFSLTNLLQTDSLLSDLPSDIILEEIVALTAVEHGQSICIYISREDEPHLKVIVPQNATIRELKKAIARHFEIYQQRTANKVKISWKYIWRTYDLSFDSLILDDDNSCIGNYGVTNKVTLSFKKKRKNPKI